MIIKITKSFIKGIIIVSAVVLSMTTMPIKALSQNNTFPTVGNVGIGTTSPNAGLQVERSSAWLVNHWQRNLILGGSGSNASAAIQFGFGSGTRWGMGNSNGNFYMWTALGDDSTIAASYWLYINSSGHLGINTLSPGSMLAIGPVVSGDNLNAHDIELAYNAGIYSATSTNSGYNAKIIPFTGTGNTEYRNYFFNGSHIFYTSGGTGSSQIEAMRISPSGNLLIGVSSQQNSSYRLDVNGNIRANKVVVNTTGADYVFNPSYHLSSLDSLTTYIHSYHHLPDVSSADEMKEGMDVGSTQTLLLQKLEELTLYMIAQDSINRKQALEISSLNRTIKNRRKTVTHNNPVMTTISIQKAPSVSRLLASTLWTSGSVEDHLIYGYDGSSNRLQSTSEVSRPYPERRLSIPGILQSITC